MARQTTPSFVHELKVYNSPTQLKVLEKRLDAARQIYNACLGEALKRLKLMRESKDYQKALSLPKELKDKEGDPVYNKSRQGLFKSVHQRYQFREYDLHRMVKALCKGNWLSEHIDSATAQKLATRAFKAVKEYALGKRGRPRFRSRNRFSSIEGKSNQTGIRWQDGKIIWKGLELSVEFDLKDKHGLQSEALCCRTKYVRLVRRRLKGVSVWFVQLIQEGTPYIKDKNKAGKETIGLDIGPSTIAYVGDTNAKLKVFCEGVDDYTAEIKKLHQKMNRSQRAMNPGNFEPDEYQVNTNGRKIRKLGKVKPGAKKWIHSNKSQGIQLKVRELNRKMQAARKSAHGELANEILRLGKTIKTEKLSYKAFQKMFGKSVGQRAPGLFIEKLRYKAANAGGEVIEFNTKTTALSQSCQCGEKHKKTLNERWHECLSCGIRAQRDLYSAFLARFVESHRLDADQAIKAWSGAGILLEQAVSNLEQTTINKFRLGIFGIGQSQSGLPVKKESEQHEALDVVACA